MSGLDDVNMEESGVEISGSKIGKLLESIEFDEYKAVLVKNKIDGRCLMKCNTIEDAVNMGITIFVKARIFLDELMKWKAEYSSGKLPICCDFYGIYADSAILVHNC